MAALNFPDAPANNAHWIGSNGTEYFWDGQKWQVSTNTTTPFLPLTGSPPDMTGPIALAGNALSALQAVPLQQLNSALGGYLPISGGTLTAPGMLTAPGGLMINGTPGAGGLGVYAVGANNFQAFATGYAWSWNSSTNLLSYIANSATVATINTTGILRTWDYITADDGTQGAIRLVKGGASNAGYVGFYAPSGGARRGYVGFGSTTTMFIDGDGLALQLNGNTTVSGSITTTASVSLPNGSYWTQDGSYTYFNWDTNNWRWRYQKSSGALQYIRGYDGGVVFTIGDGAGSYNGTFSVSSRLTTDQIMCNTGIFRVGGNDNYYFGRSANDGQWRVVENGNVTLRLDTSGILVATNAVYGNNGIYPDYTGNFRIFWDGTWRYLQWTPGWDLIWNVNSGEMIYRVNGYQNQEDFRTDRIIYNPLAYYAGIGAYANWSDERGKRDITPATEGLDAILGIEPIRYRRRPRPATPPSDREELGFSAQQLERVLPDAVVHLDNAMPEGSDPGDGSPARFMITEPILAALCNAVKTLHARVVALEGHA